MAHERDLKRFQSLRAINAISQQVVDDALATVEVDTGTVGADKANVEMAALNLEFSEIRSPVDGKTGPIQVQTGNVISVKRHRPAAGHHRPDPADQSFIRPAAVRPAAIQARPGKASWWPPSTCMRTAAARRLTAPVDFISNAVNNATGTIELRVHFANEDEALVPGQLVNVIVQLDDIPGAIVVPHDRREQRSGRQLCLSRQPWRVRASAGHRAVRRRQDMRGQRRHSWPATMWSADGQLARGARQQGHRPARAGAQAGAHGEARQGGNRRARAGRQSLMNISRGFIEWPIMTTLLMAALGDFRHLRLFRACRSANCPTWIFPLSR